MEQETGLMPLESGAESAALLRELLETQKKSLRSTRFLAAVALILALIALAATWVLIPRTLGTMEQVNASLTEVQTFMHDADEFLQDNTEAIGEVVRQVEKIDVDALNEAITNLAKAVEPLARFNSLFSRG